MFCPKCQCKCLILPWNTLHNADGRLKGIGIEERPELINMVNTFLLIGTNEENGILGQSCFDDLCRNIKDSQQDANDTSEEIIEDEDTVMTEYEAEQKEFWYYLDDRWELLLKNMHFQNAYAAYLMYYYYVTGGASAKSTKDGDVSTTRARGANTSKSTENIDRDDSKRNAAIQLNIAKSYTAVLKREFIDKHPDLYCQKKEDCGCGKAECSDCSGLKATPVRKRPKAVAL